MAVYRGDQAQLTFAAEAAQGADSEMIEGTASGASTTLSAAINAGVRSFTVASVSSMVVGDFIRIGTVESTAANTYKEHEVRRIEAINGTTLILDRPTAFYHAASEEVKELSAIGGDATRNDRAKYITFIPGVYESFTTPDPSMSLTGRRFLNTQSRRNYSMVYPGQQTLVGSVSGITLLNGWPLRFPIGNVVTTPQTKGGNTALLYGAAKKGDIYIRIDNGSGSAVSAISTAASAGASSTTAGYICIDDGSTTKSEVRRLVQAVVNTTYYKLNYPLQFDHDDNVSVDTVDADGGDYFDHVITETTDLDTVSWHVHMRDSSETTANDFDRRYVGGMIGSSTISAEEGGLVTMSWDGANFLNMIHNQGDQRTDGDGTTSTIITTCAEAVDDSETAIDVASGSAVTVGETIEINDEQIYVDTISGNTLSVVIRGFNGTTAAAHNNSTNIYRVDGVTSSLYNSTTIAAGMPRFGVMQAIDADDVGMPGANDGSSIPTTQPYYFSEGTMKFFGTEFARIASFSISISNGEEPRYYIGKQGKRARGPFEIREGARSYSMSATVTLPDSIASNASTATGATELFKQLLLEGNYGGDTGNTGITCSIKFERGTNDYIIIDIPENLESTHAAGTPGTPSSKLNRSGMYINTANHSPGTDSLLQIEMDAIFRSLKISIRDQVPVYP